MGKVPYDYFVVLNEKITLDRFKNPIYVKPSQGPTVIYSSRPSETNFHCLCRNSYKPLTSCKMWSTSTSICLKMKRSDLRLFNSQLIRVSNPNANVTDFSFDVKGAFTHNEIQPDILL